MTNFIRLIVLLFIPLTLGIVSCDNDDDATPDSNNVVDIATNDPAFSTLVGALDRTGLTTLLELQDEVTIFAPTNDAFSALGVDLESLSDDDLREILLYHVVPAVSLEAADIAEGQTYVTTGAATGPGQAVLSLLVEKTGSGVRINNAANVTSADVTGDNGVIHVIDAVLLPLDLVGHAAANENFTELVSALQAAEGDLVSVLKGEGPFTVFAPLNSAFEEISGTVASLTPQQLAQVLTYHVVSGANVISSTLTNGQIVTSVNGGTFTINLGDDDVTITDAQGNQSTVLLTDVQATNGVIHVIDNVILPTL